MASVLSLIQLYLINKENVADIEDCFKIKFIHIIEIEIKCFTAFIIGGLIGDSSFIKTGNI